MALHLIPLEKGWHPVTARIVGGSKPRVRLLCADGRIRVVWRLSGLPVGGGFLRVDPIDLPYLQEAPCTAS
jgi:hypothetical protein